MYISVAVAQFPIVLDIAQNMAQIRRIIEEVQRDELVVLPEGAISGYAENIEFLAHIDKGHLAEALSELEMHVQRRGIHLVVGSCLYEDEGWWNAGLYLSPQGKCFTYRKVNLAMHERGHMRAGAELPVFELQFAEGNAIIGLQLCREIRFPEQWRVLAHHGAQVFIYLTNAINAQKQLAVWRSHLVSRAAENQRFLLSANTAHAMQNCPTMIIAPDGSVLQEVVSEQRTILRATIDLAMVSQWYLDQCRNDVVALHY